MKNIIVADSKRHAEIMLYWLELDPKRWRCVAYGDKIVGKFLDCLIVRPLAGATPAHGDWFLDQLRPHVVGHIGTPQEGFYSFEADDGPRLAEPDWGD